MSKKFCFALDLKDDDRLITEYERHHKKIPEAVHKSILDAGIESMEIYRAGNRLFMVMEANEHFTPEAKAAADELNKDVQNWEALMWNYQEALPFAEQGEKWVLLHKIFDLEENV